MPLTLAFDTSADFCAAALVRDTDVLASRRLAMTRGHAEALIPLLQDVARDAGRALSEIDLIAVTVGPGSFTGVRTGIAAARGLALATGAPAIGVSSLEAVAHAARGDGSRPVLCVLDTRRRDYYAQLFPAGDAAGGDPEVLDAEGLAGLISGIAGQNPVLTGNAVARLIGELPEGLPDSAACAPGDGVPDPVHVARIAEGNLNTLGVASQTLSPLYLRAPEAKLPKRGGRLKERDG